MATQNYHPKRNPICAFCKRWDGDANLVFKSPAMGFQVTTSVQAKCMALNTMTASHRTGCKQYEPSVEASRLL